jgi:hypothetical protein
MTLEELKYLEMTHPPLTDKPILLDRSKVVKVEEKIKGEKK